VSVVVRTNRAINPRCGTGSANYAFVAGTSGVGSGARNGGTGYTGDAGFWRSTWTTGTSALSGGASYTQTGLSASTQYSFKVWVRASKAQTVRLTSQFQDSSSVNVGSAVNSSNVALTANVWTPTPLTIDGHTSGAAVDRVVLTAAATTGGANWANGDTFDVGLVLIETGATAGEGFTGATANTTSLPINNTYAWTGLADASTSTDTKRTVGFTVENNTTGAQSPRTQIIITDAGTTATYDVLVQRLCEGETMEVQDGAITLLDTDVVTDFACPLVRLTTYSLIWNDMQVATADITVSSEYAWVSDPLQPDRSIPVKLDGDSNPGYLTLNAESLQEVTYESAGKAIPVLGSPYPVFMGGQGQVATDVPLQMYSDDKATADDFRDLIVHSPVLLLRPLANMDPLPAVAYLTRKIRERSVTRVFNGTVAEWIWTGNLVEAVQQAVISGIATYADVQALITTSTTYATVQADAAATSYLDWRKNPLIWSTL